MKFSQTPAAIAITLSLLCLAPTIAPPSQPASEPLVQGPSQVPLLENYSMTGAIATGVVASTSLVLTLFGGKIFDQPTPSMVGAQPGSLDYRVSSSLHGDLETGAPLLGGVPDMAGYGLVVLPSIYYLSSVVYQGVSGAPLFDFQGPNINHSALAFAEAFGWTALLTTAAKFGAGRPRPYVALDRPAFDWKPEENNLSFFSGHASLSFASASFLSWDISDRLYYHTLADWNPTSRFLVGRLLPFTTLYGTASLIGFSRIYDQKHYLSDVATGAIVGTLIGNLVYLVRFEHDGTPKRRHTISPGPVFIAAEQSWGLTATLSW